MAGSFRTTVPGVGRNSKNEKKIQTECRDMVLPTLIVEVCFRTADRIV